MPFTLDLVILWKNKNLNWNQNRNRLKNSRPKICMDKFSFKSYLIMFNFNFKILLIRHPFLKRTQTQIKFGLGNDQRTSTSTLCLIISKFKLPWFFFLPRQIWTRNFEPLQKLLNASNIEDSVLARKYCICTSLNFGWFFKTNFKFSSIKWR